MIEKDDIERTLNVLVNLYDETMTSSNPDSQRILVCYAKLALLELCGWIEKAQDEIVLNYLQSKSVKEETKNDFKDDIVNKIHGFNYDTHFRKMLRHAIGVVELEKLETKLEEDQGSLNLMKEELRSIHKERNQAAHHHITETTPRYDAPSVTYDKFLKIYDLLQKIESALNAL